MIAVAMFSIQQRRISAVVPSSMKERAVNCAAMAFTATTGNFTEFFEIFRIIFGINLALAT